MEKKALIVGKHLCADEQTVRPYKAYLKYIKYKDEELEGKCYAMPYEQEYTIGRKADGIEQDIPIVTKDGCMSRWQAKLTLKKNIIGENALYIQNMFDEKRNKMNTNPTWVNGFQVEYADKYQLFTGDIVQFAFSKFEVHINPLAK